MAETEKWIQNKPKRSYSKKKEERKTAHDENKRKNEGIVWKHIYWNLMNVMHMENGVWLDARGIMHAN